MHPVVKRQTGMDCQGNGCQQRWEWGRKVLGRTKGEECVDRQRNERRRHGDRGRWRGEGLLNLGPGHPWVLDKHSCVDFEGKKQCVDVYFGMLRGISRRDRKLEPVNHRVGGHRGGFWDCRSCRMTHWGPTGSSQDCGEKGRGEKRIWGFFPLPLPLPPLLSHRDSGHHGAGGSQRELSLCPRRGLNSVTPSPPPPSWSP